MKKAISLLMVFLMFFNIISPVFAVEEDYKAGVSIERKFYDKKGEGRKELENFVLDLEHTNNNKIYVEYTMNFAPIPKVEFPVEQKNKEIVLVIDTSGSMGSNLAGHGNYSPTDPKSRIYIVKEAATLFLNKLAANDKMKISLIEYASVGDVYDFNNPMKNISKAIRIDDNGNFIKTGKNQSSYDYIYNSINGLVDGGNTNIGDPLRLASKMIANSSKSGPADTTDKYLVFLTDGQPWKYTPTSSTSGYSNYDKETLKIKKSSKYYNYHDGELSWTATEENTDKAYEYSYLMADRLGGFKKNYFLTFGPLNSGVLPTVTTRAGSASDAQHWFASTADDINTAYDEISKEIEADLKLADTFFEEILPDGLRFDLPTSDELHDKFDTDGQKVTFDMGTIAYKLEGDQYVAQPQTFGYYITFDEPGEYVFAADKNKFDYRDVEDEGDERTSVSLAEQKFSILLDPVEGFTAERPQKEGQNKENSVLLSWDPYPGASEYNIYKVFNGENKLIKTVSSENTSYLDSIEGQDGEEITYRVEAKLSNGKKTGLADAKVDGKPSILNLLVERENNSFIVSWDKIDDTINPDITGEEDKKAEIYYSLLPILEGPSIESVDKPSKVEELEDNDDIFKVVNNRVIYEFALDNPEKYTSYDDVIKFTVDAVKKDYKTDSDIHVYSETSKPLPIKQVVTTAIISSMDDFMYAVNKQVEVDIQSDKDGFPDGVFLYDPVLVVELLLPVESSDTPLEFTYPTLSVQKERTDDEGNPIIVDSKSVYDSMAVTSKTTSTGDVKVFIQLNEYKNTIMNENTNLKLNFDFAVAYEGKNGNLEQSIFDELKAHVTDLTEYQIPEKFRTLLDAEYDANIDELIKVKVYYTYNTTLKLVEYPEVRDVKVGVSSSYIKFKAPSNVTDEF
ncbi:vWA domain-containing protein [Acidaminobacter sp. JC074]|uniref:VWA domain-containing protein n=1 Tax=Acidaminobacter sp. JC074 TaxID=2530199 RepID=UPI001F0D49FC|nr:vWA domain-containing protein [Acidaminobacter sp. JC074]